MLNARPEAADERVLILAPTGRDSTLCASMLSQHHFASAICESAEELCQELSRGAGLIILAQEALNPKSGPLLEQALAAQPTWSDPPLILLAGGRFGSNGCQKAIDLLGKRANLTIIERPAHALTLLSAVRSALAARRRQYEARDMLVRLERAVQERDRFLAVLSHELRNPLGTIRNALEIADQTQDGAGQEHRQIIMRQTRQLSRLVDDLLDVSRVTAGKITLKHVPVDLGQVVQRSIDAVQIALRSHNHELRLSVVAPPVFVLGDPVRLEQIITNLLTNSIKYTPPSGHISVTMSVEDNMVVTRVKDSGIGISAETLPRLFDPFVQVDESLDRSEGGLGLGLTLVRSLVEMQHGAVSAASEGLGKGSEFTVRFPLIATPETQSAQSQEAKQSASHRILLVEDSADARVVMSRMLRLWGHHVDVAKDGAEGVEKAIELKPEIALVDIGLPLLSGFEVATQIRNRLGKSIYLVALTGYGQPEDREHTQRAGFDLHLVKPVEPELLFQLLAETPRPNGDVA